MAEDDADPGEIGRLQQRIAQLEALLERVPSAGGRGDQRKRSHSRTARPTALPVGHLDSHDEQEEQIETNFAPLVSLLRTSATRNVSPQGGISKLKGGGTESSEHVLHALRSYLPSKADMDEILRFNTSWWPLYRDSLGLVWTGCDTLQSFASHALMSCEPTVTALLLVCLAISTGNQRTYLPPVEQLILNHDQYAGTEHGLNCLMALGLCYMSSLQPRRAWTVYRRANTLLQLNGLHLRMRSEKHVNLFWQLFHADRWV